MKLPFGKIQTEILKNVVFKNLGKKRREVILGPSIGLDGAVIDMGNKSLIISTDPITGASELIGWLAVNINSNDVATFGVEPEFFLPSILLTENVGIETVKKISSQMDKAAKKLGIAIVGGHCEVTPGLTNPIIVGCALGVTEKGNYVTAGGAKPGDKLILTKSAGIEGTAILASDRERQLQNVIDASILRRAKTFFKKISVVEEAITAFKTGGVNAMHDPTEGGVFGGIHEMTDASNIGVKISEDKITIQSETVKICEFFQIDPLQLISSGTLLISAKPEFSDKIIDELERKQIRASVIGEFLRNSSDRIIVRNRKKQALPRPVSDHLWRALSSS